jgi:hypothetical protein
VCGISHPQQAAFRSACSCPGFRDPSNNQLRFGGYRTRVAPSPCRSTNLSSRLFERSPFTPAFLFSSSPLAAVLCRKAPAHPHTATSVNRICIGPASAATTGGFVQTVSIERAEHRARLNSFVKTRLRQSTDVN